jgi:hypothetical protein
VLKHLSAGLVLLEEAELGYPDHLEFAVRHLQQAGPAADGQSQDVLRKALAVMRNDAARNLMGKIKKDLEELQLRLAEPLSTAYWRAVGHMVEAEAECLGHDKELAEAIRMERVTLMADPSYKPDMAALLSRLKPEDTAKSAAEKLPGGVVNPQVTDA